MFEHIPLSSFEAKICRTEQAFEEQSKVSDLIDWEIEGVSHSFKTSARVGNILTELDLHNIPRVIWGDNEKAIQFVKREIEAKNLRHANLRLWYMRNEIQTSKVDY